MEDLSEEDTNRVRQLYEDNPSIDRIRSTLRAVGKQKIREPNKTYTLTRYKDNRTYCKFYFNTDTMAELRRLTQVSFILLFYMLEQTRYGSSAVFVTSNPFCKLTGFTRTSFYRSITQLIDEKWIFPLTEAKTYAINLFRVSKGPVDEVLRAIEREDKLKLLENYSGPRLRTRDDNIKEDDNQTPARV